MGLFSLCLLEDFFGKVKDKAENMERIIKEKDKHGKFSLNFFPHFFFVNCTYEFIEVICIITLLNLVLFISWCRDFSKNERRC